MGYVVPDDSGRSEHRCPNRTVRKNTGCRTSDQTRLTIELRMVGMKVTGMQVFWMITLMAMGMTLIMTLTPSVNAARQDIWMSIIVAGCIAFVVTLITTRTTLLYPDQNLIQLSQTILGKWLGKAVILIYFIQWYTILPIVLRQFNDVIHVMMLPLTPSWAIMLIMIALIVYATYSGGLNRSPAAARFSAHRHHHGVSYLARQHQQREPEFPASRVRGQRHRGDTQRFACPRLLSWTLRKYLMLACFLTTPRKGGGTPSQR